MTMFTIDKKELEKLNTDILANPEKYEMLLVGNTIEEIDKVKVAQRTRDLDYAKLQEQDHWFRLMNNGRSRLDSLPYAREFNEYK
jgi:hypothetical protein